MAGANKAKGGWKRVLLTVACVLLVIVLLVMIAAVFALAYFDKMWSMTVHPNEVTRTTLSSSEIAQLETMTEPEDVGGTEPSLLPEDVTWATEPAETIGGEEVDHIINILLIGQDRRPDEGRQRSDAMILCTVNTDKKTLTMTSFLRDMYVQIPGYRDNRINAAYQFGGMPLLNECLELNFGIHVDGNVEVDFGEFIQIIDLMGGVRVSLTGAEVGYMTMAGCEVYTGVNNLTGEEALTYARIRKLDSDFARTNRQRTVLTALLNKVKTLPFQEQYDLLLEVLPLITTDIETAEIMRYALTLLPILDELQVTTQHIPADGTYTNARIRGMSVLVPDLEENRQILVDSLLGQT